MSLFQQRKSERFFDEWEIATQERREERQRSDLDAYLRFAANHCEFYRERFSAYDAKSSHPLAHFPVLNSSELRDLLPPLSHRLISDRNQSFTVFQSGGTTGMPKTTLFTHEELEGLNLPNARGFFALGLKPEDRVGNLFAVGGLYMTFVHINRMLQQYGCTNFPFSNHTPPDFVHTVVKLFGVNCLTGIASVVLNCLRAMEAIGKDGIRIEKVLYGGEHLYDTDKKEIRDKYGVEVIAAPGYGTVDTWYLGYQCLHCPGGVFHAHDDQVYIEIVDEESSRACEKNQVGMMYATAFPRRLTPIIRYRVGDRAKWLGENCLCGRTTPLFKLLGRGDDVLRIGYDSVDYGAIQEVLLKVKGASGTLQMQKRRVEGRDELVLRVESEAAVSEFGAIAEDLEEKLLAARPSLREFIQKKTVLPLKVEILPTGTIPRNSRTGKLIRVIDAIGDT